MDMANKLKKGSRSFSHHKLPNILKEKDEIKKFRYTFNQYFPNFE
jgi:hypothetical protein